MEENGKTHYELLKNIYRMCMERYHDSLTSDPEDYFQELSMIYRLLIDAEKTGYIFYGPSTAKDQS